MSPSDQLREFHQCYVKCTGLDVRYCAAAERIWYDFWREEFSVADLELVLNYLRKLYRDKSEILTASIRLHRLIGDTLRFSEYLAEAKKIVRVREEHAAKESVLRATGRAVEVSKDAVPIGRVLASQEFQKFVELKETL